MATMKPRYRKQIRPLWVIFASLLWVTIPAVATADVTVAHAISLYGQPKYQQGFQHFDYVNPNAPKGGRITLPALGSFDTLNPYVLKGTAPPLSPACMV